MRTARPFTHEWLCLSDTQLYNSQIRITRGGNEGGKGNQSSDRKSNSLERFGSGTSPSSSSSSSYTVAQKCFLVRQGTVVQGQRLLFMTYSRILSGMQAFEGVPHNIADVLYAASGPTSRFRNLFGSKNLHILFVQLFFSIPRKGKLRSGNTRKSLFRHGDLTQLL
jgi:hypothetical protein